MRPQISVAIDSQTDGQNHLKIGVCTPHLLVGAIGCVGTSQIYAKWVKIINFCPAGVKFLPHVGREISQRNQSVSLLRLSLRASPATPTRCIA